MESISANGIVTLRSERSVDELVSRLTRLLEARSLKLFTIIDHSGEAASAGLSMPDTKLVVFGNPKGGTPLMLAAPLSAIDLPLKLLLWQDSTGQAWISYNSAQFLAGRYALPNNLAAPLESVAALATALAGSE